MKTTNELSFNITVININVEGDLLFRFKNESMMSSEDVFRFR
jgi:hypothetical protein